ncbi:MAG: SpoIIE family protein phosphatase, partial [bacterium]
YGLVSLRVFLGLSLLHLFFRMRLHFLRLKPKLAVLTFFVAVVPLVLVVVFFLIASFGAMGMQRASQARSVVMDWLEVETVRGPDEFAEADRVWKEAFLGRLAEPVPVDTSAGWELYPRTLADTTFETGESVRFRFSGAEDSADVFWAPADTTSLFQVRDVLWALRIEGVSEGRPSARGFRVEQEEMDRLADIVRADIVMVGMGLGSGRAEADTTGGEITVTRESGGAASRLEGVFDEGPAGPDSTLSLLDRRLYFGGAVLPYIAWQEEGGHLTPGNAVVAARKDIRSLVGEMLGSSDEFNSVLLVILSVVAVLFLLVEGAAVFLGFRITSGITSAVKKLHAGTRRLAEGELDTRIVVPNEDEFGDLALSFNQMARAVKRGRAEAVERERLERELETARAIQERLLPRDLPELQGFELAAISLPSRQVGGDYFDFVELEDGLVGVAVGDVSGKGIPAALLMANLQAALQGQAIHPSSVGQVVARVNDLIVRSSEVHMFATFFYGVLDRTTGRFTYSNAGHNPPKLLRSDGRLDLLDEGGLVLGVMSAESYGEGSTVLEPGDVLVLYSDGITEAEGPRLGDTPEDADEMPSPNHFEEERLEASIRRYAERSAQQIRDGVIEDVRTFTRGEPPSDDITLVVVKREPAVGETG